AGRKGESAKDGPTGQTAFAKQDSRTGTRPRRKGGTTSSVSFTAATRSPPSRRTRSDRPRATYSREATALRSTAHLTSGNPEIGHLPCVDHRRTRYGHECVPECFPAPFLGGSLSGQQ